MRTIKFRAWDKIDKKMYYDVGLSLIGVQVYAHPNFQPPEKIILDRGRDCFEINQFTGLIDLKGCEIYEGDIVTCLFRTKEGNKHLQGNVYFEDFMWCMDAQNHTSEDLEWTYSLNRLHYFEVIGNIYENPKENL